MTMLLPSSHGAPWPSWRLTRTAGIHKPQQRTLAGVHTLCNWLRNWAAGYLRLQGGFGLDRGLDAGGDMRVANRTVSLALTTEMSAGFRVHSSRRAALAQVLAQLAGI